MHPYDSSYLEALFKESLEGVIGPVETAFTLREGVILWGENQYNYLYSVGGVPLEGSDMDGDVQGWQIGGDLWVRYPLAKDLALPFLVRVDYQHKTRDGDGLGLYTLINNEVSYENEETALKLAVGGGIDTMLGKETRLAAGIYYNYLNSTNNFSFTAVPIANWIIDHSCPDATEHQVMLRLTGEHEFSSAFTLRGGLNFFYGWLREGYALYRSLPPDTLQDDLSLHGSHWGIGGSVGGSLKLQRITLEPFVGGGYQATDLSGDGISTVVGGPVQSLDEMDKTKREWFIGGGFSVLLGL